MCAMAPNLTKARALVAELKSLARPAILALVAPPLLFWGVSNCQESDLPPKRLPVLRTARAVHGLTPDQASLGYPVRIRGTVTFFDPYQVGHRALFIADETGDVFVAPGHLPTPGLHAGSRVEVSGVTDPGGYSPIVASSAIRKMCIRDRCPSELILEKRRSFMPTCDYSHFETSPYRFLTLR